ncbi:MAG: D-2-hydroxyacid dehydrogenase family protein [Nakamurella sp.]
MADLDDSAPQYRIAILDDYQSVATAIADWRPLAGRAEVVSFTNHLTDPEEVVSRLVNFDIVVVMRERTPLPRELLARLPRLRLLVTTGMRNASIDLAAARELGVVVSGTGMSASAPVELTWALLMALVRDVPGEDRRTREGLWQQNLPLELAGSTLGIIGLGRLGQRVAAIAQMFGMTVIAWSQYLAAADAAQHGVERVGKSELFRRSDIVSIHTVLSARTRNLVGAAELELLGSAGYLVNTSRGPIVNQADLVAALERGVIAGAALDVFDIEPLPVGHPLLTAPRTILSPHMGFVSRQAYAATYGQVVEDITGWLEGNPVRVLG